MPFISEGPASHGSLSDVTAAQHHAATVAGDINLADLNERAHGSLTGATADLHHTAGHTVASHSDTGAAGAELDTLTDTSDADALHTHPIHLKRSSVGSGATAVNANARVGVNTSVLSDAVHLHLLDARVAAGSTLVVQGALVEWTEAVVVAIHTVYERAGDGVASDRVELTNGTTTNRTITWEAFEVTI